MNERPKSFQNRELIPEKRPSNLDIIKINGRWAQVSDGGNIGDSATIRWLDANQGEIIYWDEYELVECYEDSPSRCCSVKAVQEQTPDSFTDQEIENIHWDSENKDDKNLKMQVHIFGEYRKKNKN